jgi:hypothetical protein
VQLLAIDERVLINPSHAAGIGAERHVGIGRQLRTNRVDAIGDELLDIFAARL